MSVHFNTFCPFQYLFKVFFLNIWIVNCYRTTCWKRLSFLHWIVFACLWRINWLLVYGSTSGPYSVPLICLTVSILLHFLDYYSFKILEVRQNTFSNFVPHFPSYFGCSRSFAFPNEFQNKLVNIHALSLLPPPPPKKNPWDFDWGCLNQQINLVRNDFLSKLSFPAHLHGVSLHLFRSSLTSLGSVL